MSHAPATTPVHARLGSEITTRGIRIWVEPTFVSEQSGGGAEGESWKGRKYLFAYHIKITNTGSVRARLLSRHWVIVDADGERHEVRGDGVVGHQPDLKPGEMFEYSSGCPLSTPWGTMEGAYTFEDEQGEKFEAAIGRFYLVAPVAAG